MGRLLGVSITSKTSKYLFTDMIAVTLSYAIKGYKYSMYFSVIVFYIDHLENKMSILVKRMMSRPCRHAAWVVKGGRVEVTLFIYLFIFCIFCIFIVLNLGLAWPCFAWPIGMLPAGEERKGK